MYRYLVCVLLAFSLVWTPVHAQTTGGVTYAPTFGTIMTPALISSMYGPAERTAGRASITNGPSGSVNVSRVTGVTIAGQASASMNASRNLTAVALGRAVARALPLVGTVLALKDIADDIRCRSIGLSLMFDAALECDFGTAPTLQGSYANQETVSPGDYSTAIQNAVNAQTNQLAACSSYFGVGCNVDVYFMAGPQNSCYAYTPGNSVCVYSQKGGSARASNVWSATIVNGVPPKTGCVGGVAKGSDGKCPTNNYAPTSGEVVGEKARVSPKLSTDPAGRLKDMVDQLPGFQSPTEWGQAPIIVTGPTTVTGAPTTTTQPGPITTTSTPTWQITYQGDTFTWGPTTTTTITNNNGTTTTTTTTAPQEIKTCGLPGTPACKIDETGTATTAPLSKQKADLDTAGTNASQKVKDAETPSPLPWLWGGVSLPTGACTNFEIEGPIPAIAARTFNLCTQPWVAWWRTAIAWLAGLGVVAYGWRRFSDTVENT